MIFGWIDFSKTERNKILDALNMLAQKETLDELGIGNVRDAFADRFFPGVTTIQTRAKYFFTVPYACMEIEHAHRLNQKVYIGAKEYADVSTAASMINALKRIEKAHAAEIYNSNNDKSGLIGIRVLPEGWVSRAPSDIYWSGLKKYGIFENESYSVSEYFKVYAATCSRRMRAAAYRNTELKEKDDDADDKDAGNSKGLHLWGIELPKDWRSDRTLELTRKEARFLCDRIIESCPESMYSAILRDGFFADEGVLNSLNDFKSIGAYIKLFPDDIAQLYRLAVVFSDFVYYLRIVYNTLIDRYEPIDIPNLDDRIDDICKLDIEDMFVRLGLSCSDTVYGFLTEAQKLIKNNDKDALGQHIRKREIYLKGSKRARTGNGLKYDGQWYGGGRLDYRFGRALVMLNDIFKGRKLTDAESAE